MIIKMIWNMHKLFGKIYQFYYKTAQFHLMIFLAYLINGNAMKMILNQIIHAKIMLIHKKFISQKPTMIILKQRKKEKLMEIA